MFALAFVVAPVAGALVAPSRGSAAPRCNLPATAPVSTRPWAQDRLQAERVWPLTTGDGQRVAVVDTGVDGAHPQLAGRVDAGVDVRTGNHDADHDCVGHGTFVAGIIAARPVEGVGFAGMAPGATLVPIRESGTDQVDDRNLAAAIESAARTSGIGTVNISTVTTVDYPRLRQAVRDALAAGEVVVAAAGNDAQNGDAAKYPAVYPGVLSVGAIDKQGNRSAFSETVGVDVVAPGQNLVSDGAGGTGQVVNSTGGTSYAAPFVTGVVALVRAYHPGLTPAQVVHRIEVTADHPAGPLPDAQFGWGVVDPYAAVTAVLPEEGNQLVAAPSRSPVPLAALATSGGNRRAQVAYGLAGVAVAMVLLCFALLRLMPAGRRRGWRPAARD